MKSSKYFLFIVAVIILIGAYSPSAIAVCLTCNPQCVTYARDRSGIKCTGNAGTWCGQTCASKVDEPKSGYVIELSNPAHLIYIESSSKKDSKTFSLKISHSNFTNGCDSKEPTKCSMDLNKKATYYKDKKQLKIEEGNGKGKTYSVSCIMKKK